MALPTINVFTPNTTIESADVNANFDNLKNRDTISAAGEVTIESTGDDVVIAAGSGLFKFPLVLQDSTGANTNTAGLKMYGGWRFLTSAGSSPTVDGLFTFPAAFSTVPQIVILSALGIKDGSDPTGIDDIDSATGQEYLFSAQNLSTTQFGVRVKDAGGSNLTNGRRYGFSWLAIGVA